MKWSNEVPGTDSKRTVEAMLLVLILGFATINFAATMLRTSATDIAACGDRTMALKENGTDAILGGSNSYYRKEVPIGAQYIYVNFLSGGFNLCSMSKKYSDLMGFYHGGILYEMLDSAFSVIPKDGTRFSGNVGITVGYLPISFAGLALGAYLSGKGDEIELLSEGYETVYSRTRVWTLEIPVTARIRYPSIEICPYFDIGISYSHFFSANEAIVYEFSGTDSETEDWLETDLFNRANTAHYAHNDLSFVIGAGIHLVCIFIDYRLYYGLRDFAFELNKPQYHNTDSKFVTHTINFGFDYYYRTK